ncbi:hypothetical protein PR048_032838 [Dryococelus australis]|uniref:DUF4371 domain-containing protein n=1 Tax=Dryococelus australis TaxID=614101 RepID=A0ABQ9G3B5_9NEOP|nr:hypothetical protein PR048_032838 [Dryococelus australis]
MSNKIKVELENRQFNERWENEFLCADFGGKLQCIVRAQVMSVMKEYNIRRHYETTHEVKYGSVIGEQCAIKMAKSFGDNKLAKKKNIETVSLPRQTVSRRTAEISKQLEAHLSKEIAQSNYFSVSLDEITDITDVCQLFIFAKTVDEHAKGSDIYSALVSAVNKYGGFSKCLRIVTDCAKCMAGVLCSKFVKVNYVMKDVTRIVSLIRSGNRAKSDRKLAEFLKEISAEFHGVSLRSEIHWLSAGKTLTAFSAIRKEITDFLETAGKIEYDYLENFKMRNGFAL